ncbi:MAG: YesL family protein [Caloramator sp.]|nr:YesL family protein [Caloramator sp.]
MSSKRDIFDSSIYVFSNYVWYFFVSNICFVLTSFPLILTIAAYKEKIFSEGFIFFAIAFLFEGPAIVALLSVMGKLIREKDINTVKDYFKSYRVNFLQALFVWSIQFLIIFALVEDIRIVSYIGHGKFLVPVFYVLLFLVLLMGMYMYPILTRFYFKMKDLIKFSMFFLIVKIKNTLILSLILILISQIMLYVSILCFFIFASFIAFGVMYIQKNVINDLEEMKAKQDSVLNI